MDEDELIDLQLPGYQFAPWGSLAVIDVASNHLADSSDRARAIAALLMTMLVAWNTAEFALQPMRRPPQTEVFVLIATCAVLVFIPFIRSGARGAAWGALAANLGQCLFGILGIWGSPANEGFGKTRPAVAALLTAVGVHYSAQALRKR
jgi:predicted membrane protein